MSCAVIWDVDGTIVDSQEYHWLSWRDAMAAEGSPITYEKFLASFGLRNDRILRGWLGPETTDELIERVGNLKEEEFRRLARERGLSPLPGAAKWVARLHDEGWKQAIGSSAPRLNLEAILHVLELDRYFDQVVSAEDVTRGKPDPQVFLTAAARLQIPPDRCVVVEDAVLGVEAARRAGMRSIGVSRTATLDADIYVRSLADLPEDAFSKLVGSRQ